ncbi:MAG: HPr-rel-A system PqqD family peptide chaperone [Sphingomonas sp.]
MTVYCAAPAVALRQLAIDGLTFIYHRTSGVTHILASPAPEILAALAGQPLTADALMAVLARDYALAAADREALLARLDELVCSGLVAAA